jgi:Putative zinc-finger
MAGTQPSNPAVRCERARQWTSLRLDGELSALEAELLDRHLDACAACRTFAARVASAAELLRSAPSELPARRFEVPAAPTRGISIERRTALVAAAALALGALAGSLLERPAPQEPVAPAPQFSLLSRDLDQLRELPRATPKPTPDPVRSAPPNPPEGVI